tara:strand:+ start:41 stop:415 length:375 start_codon:yes stop_codon:yes gene_type:complete
MKKARNRSTVKKRISEKASFERQAGKRTQPRERIQAVLTSLGQGRKTPLLDSRRQRQKFARLREAKEKPRARHWKSRWKTEEQTAMNRHANQQKRKGLLEFLKASYLVAVWKRGNIGSENRSAL